MKIVGSILMYPAYVLASLAATVFACVAINWWAPLLCEEQGNLPRWLGWFQTFDATLDAGWRDGYIDGAWGSTPVRRFAARVYWLYRNPAYGWDYWPLGLPFAPKDWRVVRYVESEALTLFVSVGPGFNVYYHGRFGMFKLGWKAWNYWNDATWKSDPFGPAWRVPLAFSISPFKRKG